MNANELLFWLKGHFELSNEAPSSDAWGRIKAEVINSRPVETFVINGAAPPQPRISGLPFPPIGPIGGCDGC